jgi:DNA mismatch repair ATPase MutS
MEQRNKMAKISTPMKKNSDNIKNFKNILSKIIKFTELELHGSNTVENDFLLIFKLKDKPYLGQSIGIAYNGFLTEHKLVREYKNEDIQVKLTFLKEENGQQNFLENTLDFDTFVSKLKEFNKQNITYKSFEEFLLNYKTHFAIQKETPLEERFELVLKEVKEHTQKELNTFKTTTQTLKQNIEDNKNIEIDINNKLSKEIDKINKLENELKVLKHLHQISIEKLKEETGFNKNQIDMQNNIIEINLLTTTISEKVFDMPKLSLKNKEDALKEILRLF